MESFFSGSLTLSQLKIIIVESKTVFPFLGTDWENLPNTTPPDLLPYLPSTCTDQEGLRSKYRVKTEKTN